MIDMKDENTDYFIVSWLILVSYNSFSSCWSSSQEAETRRNGNVAKSPSDPILLSATRYSITTQHGRLGSGDWVLTNGMWAQSMYTRFSSLVSLICTIGNEDAWDAKATGCKNFSMERARRDHCPTCAGQRGTASSLLHRAPDMSGRN